MALDSKRTFTNAIVGMPQVGGDVAINDVHATPRVDVGTIFQRADGNLYQYGYSGLGTTAGRLVAPTFASSGLTLSSNNVIATASAVAVPGDTITAGNIGSRFVEITLAAVTANQYAGGYLCINGGSGLNYSYRIKGNTATDNPATGNIRIELREPLVALLNTNTDVIILPCEVNDFTAADPSTNFIVAGVAVSTTTTTKPYGWVCRRGNVQALQQGTVVAGQAIMLSQTVTGAYTLFGGTYTTVAQLLGLRQIGICTGIAGDGLIGEIRINCM